MGYFVYLGLLLEILAWVYLFHQVYKEIKTVRKTRKITGIQLKVNPVSFAGVPTFYFENIQQKRVFEKNLERVRKEEKFFIKSWDKRVAIFFLLLFFGAILMNL
jgi:hypothetical protein